MSETGKVFKYKLDFYYQSALIYLLTLVAYGGIRGSFVESRFEYVLDDPLMYVILFFVVMSFVTLGLNRIRDRRLIVTDDSVTFKNRFHEQSVRTSEIEWMHVGRESRVRTGGLFHVVVFKLNGRRRLFRIRAGRYERAHELVAEMQRLSTQLPKRKPRMWRRPRVTDR